MEGLPGRCRTLSMIRYRISPEVIALILRTQEERRYGRFEWARISNVITRSTLPWRLSWKLSHCRSS